MKKIIADIISIGFIYGIIGPVLLLPLIRGWWFITVAIIFIYIIATAIEYSGRLEVYNPKTNKWEKCESPMEN